MPLGERPRSPGEPTYTIGEDSPAILRLAASQARELGHDVVDPAHLLLAILAEQDDPAARLLNRHGVTFARAREAVARMPPAQHTSSSADGMRLTSRGVFAMHRARRQALRHGTTKIAPMHLLLALVDSRDASETLGLTDINITAVRDDARSQLDA